MRACTEIGSNHSAVRDCDRVAVEEGHIDPLGDIEAATAEQTNESAAVREEQSALYRRVAATHRSMGISCHGVGELNIPHSDLPSLRGRE